MFYKIIEILLVSKFLERGDPLVLPDGYPQEKQIVVEQLQILKSLSGGMRNSLVNKVNNDISILGTASGSSTSNSGYQKITKTTSFVANSESKCKRTTGLTMLEKLKFSEPYNLLFTRIPESPETLKQQDSITITGW